jgi:hypothetical protein
MAERLIIGELSVVVAGRNHNPSILNPDFLKFNDIVPRDWQVAQPPICTEMISQVAFDNGVGVLSQQGKIVFSEPISADGGGSVEVPGVAQRYLRTVPHVSYQAVGINPKGHVAFASEAAALECAKGTFLAKGPWLDFEGGIQQIAIKSAYNLEGRTLHMTIETGSFQRGDTKSNVIIFAANFHHVVSGDNTKDCVASAIRQVGKWEEDVSTFRSFVENRILGEKA